MRHSSAYFGPDSSLHQSRLSGHTNFANRACELGAAGLAFGFVLTDLDTWQIFGFGSGAVTAEAVMVAMMENVHAGGLEGEHVAAQLAKMRSGPLWLQAFVPFVDRCIATADHIACRGLLAAGIASRRTWPLVVAFGVFAATDGFGQYRLRSKWRFAEPVVAA
jgi:hypothetical protein